MEKLRQEWRVDHFFSSLTDRVCVWESIVFLCFFLFSSRFFYLYIDLLDFFCRVLHRTTKVCDFYK